MTFPLFIVFAIVAFVSVFLQDDLQKRKRQKELEAIEKQFDKEKLFVLCFEERIHTLANQRMLDKLTLIANSKNISGSKDYILEQFELSKADAVKRGLEYYRHCQKHHLEKDSVSFSPFADEVKTKFGFKHCDSRSKVYYEIGKAFHDVRPELQLEEGKEKAKNERLLPFRGRDKRIQMLMYERDKCLEKLKGRNLIDPNAFQQKEHDWATMGGIASGIAGGAAGVATALDYQRQNAQIRQSNAQISAAVGMMNMYIERDIDSLKSSVESYCKEIESSYGKLIGDISQEETQRLMKLLVFSNKKITISKTGAVRISVEVSSQTKSTLYDGEVNARIDGLIRAKLSTNGVVKGSAVLPLPIYGVDTYQNKVEGICTETTDPNGSYTVEYEPIALWLIER